LKLVFRAGVPLLTGIVAYPPVTIFVVYLSVPHGRADLSLAVSLFGLLVTTACALLLIPAMAPRAPRSERARLRRGRDRGGAPEHAELL
jgi:hypothetical protein